MSLRVARSYVYVPGNRPERFDEVCAAGADAVIVVQRLQGGCESRFEGDGGRARSLFRYSAPMANGHRMHYDRSCVTQCTERL